VCVCVCVCVCVKKCSKIKFCFLGSCTNADKITAWNFISFWYAFVKLDREQT
jgi:hypothetical protein